VAVQAAAVLEEHSPNVGLMGATRNRCCCCWVQVGRWANGCYWVARCSLSHAPSSSPPTARSHPALRCPLQHPPTDAAGRPRAALVHVWQEGGQGQGRDGGWGTWCGPSCCPWPVCMKVGGKARARWCWWRAWHVEWCCAAHVSNRELHGAMAAKGKGSLGILFVLGAESRG